jgi:hypothetical protein
MTVGDQWLPDHDRRRDRKARRDPMPLALFSELRVFCPEFVTRLIQPGHATTAAPFVAGSQVITG